MYSSRYRCYLQPISKEITFFFFLFCFLQEDVFFSLSDFSQFGYCLQSWTRDARPQEKNNGHYPRNLLLSLFLSTKEFLNMLLTYTERF